MKTIEEQIRAYARYADETLAWIDHSEVVPTLPIVDFGATEDVGENVSARPREPRRSPVMAAVMVAALVLVVVLVSRNGEDGRPLDVTSTDAGELERVGELYMDAWVKGDHEALEALSVGTTPYRSPGKDSVPDLLEWQGAIGWALRPGTCTASSGKAEFFPIIGEPRPSSWDISPWVVCSYTYENDLTRALGWPPEQESVQLQIRDGAVSYISGRVDFPYEFVLTEASFAFANWVRTTHPEDMKIMYRERPPYGRLMPNLDPASIALWDRHVDEFTAALAGGLEPVTFEDVEQVGDAYMDAWVDGDHGALEALVVTQGSDGIIPETESVSALMEWQRAIGWVLHDRSCLFYGDVSPEDEHPWVLCSYSHENDLIRALGRKPAPGVVSLKIGDGVIHDTSSRFGFPYDFESAADVWLAFAQWVASAHPGDSELMYASRPPYGPLMPNLEPASIALWAEHVDDFTASFTQGSDPDTYTDREAYGARVRAICASATARNEAALNSIDATWVNNADEESTITSSIARKALEELRALTPPRDMSERVDSTLVLIQKWIDDGANDESTYRQKNQIGGDAFENCPVFAAWYG